MLIHRYALPIKQYSKQIKSVRPCVQFIKRCLFTGQGNMEGLKIDKVENVPCENSKYLILHRVAFEQNKHKRVWDYVKVHDAVAVMIFNTTRNSFVLVKQFRPAVYMYEKEKAITNDKDIPSPTVGVTFELCAGIVDTNESLVDIAIREAKEETGYEIPSNNIKRINQWRGNVGIGGNSMTMFYAEVTDDMQMASGGGNMDEGEFIELFYLPVEKAKDFVFDESIPKPAGLVAAFMWYFWKNKLF